MRPHLLSKEPKQAFYGNNILGKMAEYGGRKREAVGWSAPLDEELKFRDSGHQVIRENRLAHKREGMALFIGNIHESICVCISRKEQNFAVWTGSLEPDCQLDAVHLRHEHIGNQDAWATRLRSLHHLLGVREGGRLKAGRIQDSGDKQCGSRLIVHHEDGLRVVFWHC